MKQKSIKFDRQYESRLYYSKLRRGFVSKLRWSNDRSLKYRGPQT